MVKIGIAGGSRFHERPARIGKPFESGYFISDQRLEVEAREGTGEALVHAAAEKPAVHLCKTAPQAQAAMRWSL